MPGGVGVGMPGKPGYVGGGGAGVPGAGVVGGAKAGELVETFFVPVKGFLSILFNS